MPQVKLPKQMDFARDADRTLDSVPRLIVADWVEAKFYSVSTWHNLPGHIPKKITVGKEVGLVFLCCLLSEVPLHRRLKEGSSPVALR